MRATSHSARFSSHDFHVFNPGHNDRSASDKMPNVFNELSDGNIYMSWNNAKNFEESEKQFYEQYFSTALNLQNERHKKSRHYDRIRTMDDIRTDKRTCPDERIISIGNSDEHVDAQILIKVFEEHVRWHRKQYPQVQILNISLHVDEIDPVSGTVTAPHIHIRTIAYAHDENNNLSPEQDKAFQQMGINLPFPNRKKSRYNNRKMIYSAECRQNILDICMKMGISIETKPKNASKSGLSLTAYKRMREEEKMQNIQLEYNNLQSKYNELYTLYSDMTDKYCNITEQYEERQRQIREITEKQQRLNEEYIKTEQQIKEAEQKLKEMMELYNNDIEMAYNAINTYEERQAQNVKIHTKNEAIKWGIDEFLAITNKYKSVDSKTAQQLLGAVDTREDADLLHQNNSFPKQKKIEKKKQEEESESIRPSY